MQPAGATSTRTVGRANDIWIEATQGRSEYEWDSKWFFNWEFPISQIGRVVGFVGDGENPIPETKKHLTGKGQEWEEGAAIIQVLAKV